MIVFELIFQHQQLETSSKMASTLGQKILTISCQKAHNFVYQFESYDFVQILPEYGRNTYQIVYGETLDFQCQHQQW